MKREKKSKKNTDLIQRNDENIQIENKYINVYHGSKRKIANHQWKLEKKKV